MRFILFLAFVSPLQWGALSVALPARVLIIRHAEKPRDADSPYLSEKGYRRAEALKNIFNLRPEYAPNGPPDFLFAAQHIPGQNSMRSIETLLPLSQTLARPIRSDYKSSETVEVARLILNAPEFQGQTLFFSWVHGKIPALAKAIKGHCPADWKDDVYDRIWIIDYTSPGARCTDVPQALFPDDSK